MTVMRSNLNQPDADYGEVVELDPALFAAEIDAGWYTPVDDAATVPFEAEQVVTDSRDDGTTVSDTHSDDGL